ncbi:ABC transporter substrate-binding protein [Usitatibacter palustris]|uniref:Heme-binding protein A n=1 Tax=Usitatibacter palustris TaxID=2732487 RepID=A0A6M4H8X0_9PROT|nr:ABC transporter substrate-binding protein [Usitatibacter palustris]QJR16169.1 Heme-binding protein A [Usitatibacter palustris]
MTTRRAASAALFVFALLPALAAGKTLRYASQLDPQTADPHAANLLATARLVQQVYDPLVWRDKNWKPIPWLAVSWTQTSPTVWRFKLREGVKFHDGTPFTADDIVFSVERTLAPTSQMRTAIQGVESAKKIDAFTVDLILKEPNPALLHHLTNFRIMSKAWCVKNRVEKPQDYKNKEETYTVRNANGTGPFVLKEWTPDVRVRLEQNKDWWGHKEKHFESNITEVVMLPINSSATRLAALLSGEVDLVIDPPTQDVARLKSNPQLSVLAAREMRVQYLTFDMKRDELLYGSEKQKNPWKDLRVRQAVAHAIDADAIKTKVMRGMSNPNGSVITDLIAGYDPAGDKRLPYDRERAKKLLADAGYAKGFDVTLDCGNNQPASDICQAVSAMLTQVGIRTRPNIIIQSSFFPKIEKYDTSFYLLSWGGGVTSDALYTLNALLHTVGTKGEGDFNMGRYSSPEMDKLIDRVKGENDPVKRNAAIRDALVLANRELPVVPIHQPVIPWVMRKNVSAWYSPVNTVYFYRARID